MVSPRKKFRKRSAREEARSPTRCAFWICPTAFWLCSEQGNSPPGTRALLALKDREKEPAVAAKIAAGGLSVRAAEELVKKENLLTRKEEDPVPELGLKIDYYAELERRAMDLLGRRVRINRKGSAKSVQVSFEDDEDLEILLRKLCGEEIIEQ